MPIFVTYDMSDVTANRTLSVEGSLEDAAVLLKHGNMVFRQHKKWADVKWSGVFVPEFVMDSRLSLPPMLAMFLDLYIQQNALRPFSNASNKRFEANCLREFGVSVSVKYLPQTLGHWVTPSKRAAVAVVDGDSVHVNNWSLQRAAVGADGSLIPSADPGTVVYNTCDIGSFWLARWTYRSAHYFATLSEPYFEDVTSLLLDTSRQQPTSVAIEFDTFGNTREIYYNQEATSSENDTDPESSEGSDSNEGADGYTSDDEDPQCTMHEPPSQLEFNLYTREEQTMLPLGYMVPRAIEWQYMFSAITSNFNQIKSLVKVRDVTLRDFYTLFGAYSIYEKYATGARRLLYYIRKRLDLLSLEERMNDLSM